MEEAWAFSCLVFIFSIMLIYPGPQISLHYLIPALLFQITHRAHNTVGVQKLLLMITANRINNRVVEINVSVVNKAVQMSRHSLRLIFQHIMTCNAEYISFYLQWNVCKIPKMHMILWQVSNRVTWWSVHGWFTNVSPTSTLHDIQQK